MKVETESRIFSVGEYVRPFNGEPIRSVVLATNDSVVVVWHVHPEQEKALHVTAIPLRSGFPSNTGCHRGLRLPDGAA
ncbi:hypothetical protein [Halomonas llamarensis]|uniref:hypothetical protein n=1 Tax=Halomonas llamarensis TaxID=2945104 RepID=UPI003D352183